MLVTQGTESFRDCFKKIFTFEKKDPKKTQFSKAIKETPEYKNAMSYIEDGLSKNHPKLRKLTEILQCFFNDDKHKGGSKVIVFT